MRKKDGFAGQQAIVLPRKVITKCKNLSIVNNLFITDIGYYPKATCHYRERQHGCEQHILIYCVNGNGSAVVNGKNFQIHPFEYLFLPASIAHIYQADPEYPWTIYWVHFRGNTSGPVSQLLYQKMLSGHNYVQSNEEFIHLFQNIYQTLQTGYSIDNLVYASLSMHYLLSSFIFPEKISLVNKPLAIDIVDQAVHFLQNNIQKVLSLKDISSNVNLSTSQFSKLFHKKTGYSPIDYFNHLKMQHACQLLQFTNQRINEIARAIGIDDPFYFSRLFHNMMGISPKDYRNKKEMKEIKI